MRPLLALLAAALLGTTAVACGSATKTSGSTEPTSTSTSSESAVGATPVTTPAATTHGGYVTEDGDQDGDDGPHPSEAGQDDGPLLAVYPGRANRTEARAITELVKRYYAASFAGDGASACALLSASIAKGLVADQTKPTQGARDSCVEAISPLLAQQHQHLTAEDPATMAMTGVHLNGNLALVALRFKRAPEREIIVQREGRTWKIDAPFDVAMT
jgi:ketosteroid isomerase-like protein